MASDNTAEITFDADLSGLTDALEQAAAGVASFGDQTDAVFAGLTAAMGKATALAPTLSQSLANIQAPSAEDEVFDSIIDHKMQAIQNSTQQIGQLQAEAAEKASQQWNDVATSISRAFTTSVQGIVLGTQTIQQAMRKLAENIVVEFIDGTIQKMVQQWIAGNQTIQSATEALQGFLGISDAANAAASVTTAQTAASANISAYASEGAAAAVASTAAIPLVGPELAPAAGTAIYADIMSFDIASAAGGWMVPSDQLAMVHENERVLPARYSAGLDAMVGTAASGQGQGGHTFNNSFHINATDGVTARQLPGMIQSHLERSVRNGSFGRMSRT